MHGVKANNYKILKSHENLQVQNYNSFILFSCEIKINKIELNFYTYYFTISY